MCVPVWVCDLEFNYHRGQKRALNSLETVIGHCELPDVGPGTWTQVLW